MMTAEFDFPDSIECESRLALKAVGLGNARDFFKVIQENQSYFSEFDFIAPNFASMDLVVNIIEKLIHFKENREGANYGFWLDDQLLGLFTINSINLTMRSADLGYWLTKEAAGKGLAEIALKTLMASLKGIGFDAFTASTAISNFKSQRLLTKVGFKKEKILRKNIIVRGNEIDEILFVCRNNS
jgi:ribosomal-protein-serine acetyltransferase